MIQLIVPLRTSGGVYDFACKLRDEIGSDRAQLIHLSSETVKNWKIGEADTVILQMSGYGFAMRGAPVWLLHEIRRRRKTIKVFGVFFHELYAVGSPWSSSFWLSPVQRHISRKLVEMCDFWLTNREGTEMWLRRYGDDKPHTALPVFSNIGEAMTYTEIRLSNIVVFGSPDLRAATYEAAGDGLFEWAKNRNLQIHDIGGPIKNGALCNTLRANNVVQHGFVDKAQVQLLMSDASYGLVAYPADYVAKSGVFAAYCANGICPVLFSKKYLQTDQLVAGTHYLKELPVRRQQLARKVGQSAFAWYQAHNLQKHRECLMAMIQKVQEE